MTDHASESKDRPSVGMSRRIGSLCTGILGLDRAVAQHFGAELAWYSEIEPAPTTVIEREHPGVLNLGDLKTIDWADVPPVDVLTAGYPCQPFSHAGKRKGKDDPRHLWPFIIDGVRHLRPHCVVLENVRGHVSMGLDAVLGSLAEAGFDAEWCVLRASDVGAPHQRARLFIVATNSDHHEHEVEAGHVGIQSQWPPNRRGAVVPTRTERDGIDSVGSLAEPHARTGGSPGVDAGAPADARGERHGGGQDGRAVGRVDGRHEGEARQRQRPWEVALDRGDAAPADAGGQRLDGWPDLERDGRDQAERSQARDHAGDGGTAWGVYEPAIRRWERLTRPAPHPTESGVLSSAFVEWMMGYPEGWVDGLTRTQALKALGNAVVTQQALAALAELSPLACPFCRMDPCYCATEVESA